MGEFEEGLFLFATYSIYLAYFSLDFRKFSNLLHGFPSSIISYMDNFINKDIHFILNVLLLPHKGT